MNNKEMARDLDISVRTVETHRLVIRRKLNIDKPAALVKYAIDQGIISPISRLSQGLCHPGLPHTSRHAHRRHLCQR